VDADNDGVADGTGCDDCPNTPSGLSVSGRGCARVQVDGDGDGVCDGAVDPQWCYNGGGDNCPRAVNTNQVDVDNDGRGDAW
jgi:syndecan 4